jgi:hypothetical protein
VLFETKLGKPIAISVSKFCVRLSFLRCEGSCIGLRFRALLRCGYSCIVALPSWANRIALNLCSFHSFSDRCFDGPRNVRDPAMPTFSIGFGDWLVQIFASLNDAVTQGNARKTSLSVCCPCIVLPAPVR